MLLNDGRGQLRRASGSPSATGGFRPQALALGDFNSDRRLDAAVVHQSGDVGVLLGDGRGVVNSAAGSPFVTGGFHPVSIAVGEFNGDGQLDATVSHTSRRPLLSLEAKIRSSGANTRLRIGSECRS